MKKLILLMLLILPLSIFGQEKLSKKELWKSQKEAERFKKELSFKSKTSGDFLISSSKNFQIGAISFIGGGAVTTALVLIGQSSDSRDALNIASYTIGVASFVAGTVFTVKGCIDLNRAGKRLNYEIKANEAKLAFNF